MNKILSAIIIVLLIIISLMTCKIKTGSKAVTATTARTSGGCPDTFCMVSHIEGDIPGMLSGSTLAALSDLYFRDKAKSKINYATDAEPAKDALSICFDLKKMKELIFRIESNACNSGCADGKELGIRFYYIKYPEKVGPDGTYEELRALTADCANKHAIAMVAAYKEGESWYDFDYEIPDKTKACNLKSASVNSKHIGLIVQGDGTNHGGMAPPPDPGTYPIVAP